MRLSLLRGHGNTPHLPQYVHTPHTHTDVRALLGGDALFSDARAQSIFRELNLKHFTAVDTPNGNKALLTPYGEQSSAMSPAGGDGVRRHYLEPESGTVIEVDHVKQTCIGQRDAEEGEATCDAVRALRSGISVPLRDYVAETYPGGTGAVYASMKEGDKEVAVCISSLKVSPRNFWYVYVCITRVRCDSLDPHTLVSKHILAYVRGRETQQPD